MHELKWCGSLPDLSSEQVIKYLLSGLKLAPKTGPECPISFLESVPFFSLTLFKSLAINWIMGNRVESM